jgi:pyridoxal phosphate enzyme (YggS family)
MTVKDNISRVYERISLVCSQNNRSPDLITIVAVSKGRSPKQIKEAIAAGITDIGENKVQEAIQKLSDASSSFGKLRTLQRRTLSEVEVQPPAVKWHMVGHLQTNKAKQAVKIFDLIQSVDSVHLAVEIDKQSAKINKIQDILIELKTSPEATKSGIKLVEAKEVIKRIAGFKNINLKGLMTIAPLVDNPQKARPYFRILRELIDEINTTHITPNALHILSMGMSDDFEVAIQEGSTMVRVGRAIFN